MRGLPYRPSRGLSIPQHPPRSEYSEGRDRGNRSQYGGSYRQHRPAERPHYENESYGRGTTNCQRRVELPSKRTFEQAAFRLHEALDEAGRFYKSFHDDFERDVRSIKTYASLELIVAIWDAKIYADRKGEQHPQRAGRQLDQHSVNGCDEHESEQRSQRFPDTGIKLGGALVDAMGAVPRRGQQRNATPDDIETTRLVMGKLQMAYRNIGELLNRARKHPARMPALLREINSTLRIMEENSEIWNPHGRGSIDEKRHNVDDGRDSFDDRRASVDGGRQSSVGDCDSQGGNRDGQGNDWDDYEHVEDEQWRSW